MAGSSDFKCPFNLQHQDEYELDQDGNVLLSVKLDKDNVQCCVCYEFMTSVIFRCQNPGHVHNVCSSCEWQIRRMKTANGHSKPQCCPLCSYQAPFVRNAVLEKQLFNISIPCSQKNCPERFFPWDEESRLAHMKNCMHSASICPLCNGIVKHGVTGFVHHIEGSNMIEKDNCSLEFKKRQTETDVDKHLFTRIRTGESSYVINERGGYVLLFLWKKFYFDVIAMACAPELGSLGNDQIYLDWVRTQELEVYKEKIKCSNYLQEIRIPVYTSIISNILRLKPRLSTNNNNQNPIHCGQIFCGELHESIEITVRFFTLAEGLRPGSTIECRDFTEKWYEAEVFKITAAETSSCVPTQRNVNPLVNRRILVHYLGYSANYDEWFDLSRDSHRIAHRGTHTIGPNLRAIRRNHHSAYRQSQNLNET